MQASGYYDKNKGATLDHLGKPDEALKCYDKAIEINPNYAKAWFNKGIALSKLGRPDEALKCYDKAIEINPNYAKTGTNRTQLLPDFPIP